MIDTDQFADHMHLLTVLLRRLGGTGVWPFEHVDQLRQQIHALERDNGLGAALGDGWPGIMQPVGKNIAEILGAAQFARAATASVRTSASSAEMANFAKALVAFASENDARYFTICLPSCVPSGSRTCTSAAMLRLDSRFRLGLRLGLGNWLAIAAGLFMACA